MTAPRPDRLLEDTPSMQWADQVDESRRSKIVVAIMAIALLFFAAGFILGIAVS